MVKLSRQKYSTLPRSSRTMTDSRPYKKARRSNDDQNTIKIDSFTLEEHLSVPLSLIFRKVPRMSSLSGGALILDPLFSREEAKLLLSVQLLSQEMDSLVLASAEVLQHKALYKTLSDDVMGPVDHPYLRPLQVQLRALTNCTADRAIEYTKIQMDRVLIDLQAAMHNLNQYADKNWASADELSETQSDTSIARAERMKLISNIQTEVSNRIEDLILRKTNMSVSSQHFSMADFCKMQELKCPALPELPGLQATTMPSMGEMERISGVGKEGESNAVVSPNRHLLKSCRSTTVDCSQEETIKQQQGQENHIPTSNDSSLGGFLSSPNSERKSFQDSVLKACVGSETMDAAEVLCGVFAGSKDVP